MKTLINGRLIIPNASGDFEIVTGKALNFDEKIFSIGEVVDGGEIFDAENNFVAPGFVNIHIHGAAGVDTMDDDGDGCHKFFADDDDDAARQNLSCTRTRSQR